MTECNTKFSLEFYKNRRLEIDFSGGELSSDGGVLLLRQADESLGLIASLSRCIKDPRERCKISHEQESLLRQRVLQIAAGYEDVVDSNELRDDPVFQIACNRLPFDTPLASQPTLTTSLLTMMKLPLSLFLT